MVWHLSRARHLIVGGAVLVEGLSLRRLLGDTDAFVRLSCASTPDALELG